MQTTEKSSVIVCSFSNINPINTVAEAIERGHYDSHDPFITDETVPFAPAKDPKNLHLVCFNRVIRGTKYVELLLAEGKQPCRNAPAYLAGLMAQVPEDQMPAELRHKDLVAAEPDNTSSTFAGEGGDRCFLYVRRSGGNRRLSLMFVDREWSGDLAFLVEDLVP
jgi:hypothetical protein